MSTSQCTSVGAANKSTIPQLSLHCCTCRLGFLNLWQHRLASTYPTVMMDIEWQHFPAVLYVVAAVWYFNLPSCFTMSHYYGASSACAPESLVPGEQQQPLLHISTRLLQSRGASDCALTRWRRTVRELCTEYSSQPRPDRVKLYFVAEPHEWQQVLSCRRTS